MIDNELKQAMADLLDGEPMQGVDVDRALEAGRSARRARQLKVGLACVLTVAVVGAGVPVAFSHLEDRADVLPAGPLPVTGTPTTIAPACRSHAAADIGGWGVLSLPSQPGLRWCEMAASEVSGRVQSAFGVVREGKVSLDPFTFTLPAGWHVAQDTDRNDGWAVLKAVTDPKPGYSTEEQGSHVLDLQSPDGQRGLILVTQPNLTGGKSYQGVDAAGMAVWTQRAHWFGAGALQPITVGGQPAWLTDLPQHLATDLEQTCKDARCPLLGSFTPRPQPVGLSHHMESTTVAWIRPGTTRLAFFPSTGDPGSSVGVVAVLWDRSSGPDGLDNIRTKVQPILDSIRFGTGPVTR